VSMKIVSPNVWKLSFPSPWQPFYYKYELASFHSLNKDFKRAPKVEINL
jgi:hypothetical protein